MNNDLYGEDILLNETTYQAVLAATGDVVVSDGVQTVIQDLRLRLMTPLGTLFYDQYFGSLLHEFVRDENTEFRRMAFVAEVERRIRMDSRVLPNTVSCRIDRWDPLGIEASVGCRLIYEPGQTQSFVIRIGDDMEKVIKDVYPRQ
jgi:phage baseplate assembly protein W